MGLINNEFIFNPTYEQQENSILDLIVAGTEKKSIMLEAGAQEVKEEIILEAIRQGQEKMQEAISLIKELQSKVEISERVLRKQLIDPEEQKIKEEKLNY